MGKLLLLLFSFMTVLFMQADLTFAHSGRTDSSGCHMDSSTGVRHCHNGNSNSSSNSNSTSTYEHEIDYRYQDNDNNGVNDFEEDIKAEGEKEGSWDAFYELYKPDPSYSSATKRNWYLEGYDIGYKRRSNQLLTERTIKEAQNDGYEAGQASDNLTIPDKYVNVPEAKKEFEENFVKGQENRWLRAINYAAATFAGIDYPDDLDPSLIEYIEMNYRAKTESEINEAYEQGYQSAFNNINLTIPEKFEKIPPLKEAFTEGFHSNDEIEDFLETAYKDGNSLDDYQPTDRLTNDVLSLYKEQYEEGKKDRLTKIGLIAGIIAIFLVLVNFFYKKQRKAKSNLNNADHKK